MPTPNHMTTVVIRKQTHAELVRRRKAGETFDDVIRRLLGKKPLPRFTRGQLKAHLAKEKKK